MRTPRFSALARTLSRLNLRLDHRSIRVSDVRRQKKTAIAITQRLYASPSVPGVILGDEVGMGKTYVALALAAALSANRRPRILILAHSREMAQIWRARWEKLVEKNPGLGLPEANEAWSLEGLGAGVWFGAYDTFKHVSSAELQSTLREVLRGRGTPRRIHRKRLVRALFGGWSLSNDHEVRVGAVARAQFWCESYDWENNDWYSVHSARRNLKRLYFDNIRERSKFDLLIIDEAHKLEGSQREEFFDHVFHSRARRVLLVTATPFSLTTDELLSRIRNLFDFCGRDPSTVCGARGRIRQLLQGYKKLVDARQQPSKVQKAALTQELGRYFVRSSWPSRQRKAMTQEIPPRYTNDGSQIYAMLRLEKAFAELYSSGNRTQISQNRNTLCSSYAAVINSSRNGNMALSPLADFLHRMRRESGSEHPKLEYCADWITENIRPPNKVVVFCNRLATIRELGRRVRNKLHSDSERVARQWDSYRKPGGLSAVELSKLRFAFYADRNLVRRSPTKAIEWADQLGQMQDISDDSYWISAWGKGRHASWVSTLSGERTDRAGLRSNETVRFAFNLPGPPYILICSAIAREGIDLHRACRRVMHYDLEWSPTAMEQRVGRVDRVGSLASEKGAPVEVLVLRNPGTYEDRMLSVVQERMQMVRVLLGAGNWLDSHSLTSSFDDLERYRLDFSPRT